MSPVAFGCDCDDEALVAGYCFWISFWTFVLGMQDLLLRYPKAVEVAVPDAVAVAVMLHSITSVQLLVGPSIQLPPTFPWCVDGHEIAIYFSPNSATGTQNPGDISPA